MALKAAWVPITVSAKDKVCHLSTVLEIFWGFPGVLMVTPECTRKREEEICEGQEENEAD